MTVARELYDHHADPLESRNLADRDDQQAVIEQQANLLRRTNPVVTPGWAPVLIP